MTQGSDVVGRSIERVDGTAKVTGTARYVDDYAMDDMLWGRTVRSQVAHGVLRSIELDPDFDWSDLVVVTAEHIRGANFIALISEDQPALVPIDGRIRHIDEAVALIAGVDSRAVNEALGHIKLRVDPLPTVFDIAAAKRGEGPVHNDDNLLKEIIVHKGDCDAGLTQAQHVIAGTYKTGAQEQMYIEPQGILAWWDEHGRVNVLGSLQCPYYVHAALKKVHALEDSDIVVSQAMTGGGFGGKEEYPSMLAAHATLLARQAGKPVKMIYDRAEDIGATTKRHPAEVRHRLGVRQDGTITAINIEVDLDGGAYTTLTPVVLSRAVLHAAGPYRCDNVRVVGRAWATNCPPHGAFRGFGAPQTTFAYERQMDKAARALGMDPFALRRHNMLGLGDETATGQVLKHSVASAQVLDAVDRSIKRAAPPSPAPPHLRRGAGLAFYLHGAGFTGRGEERLKGKAAVALTAEGRFEVRSASTEIGQGAATTFTQIAASTLGVPPELVHVLQPQTDKVPDSGPTVASRTCMVVGSVVQQAAQKLKQRLHDFAEKEHIPLSDIGALARAFAEAAGEHEEVATYASPPGIHFDEEAYRGDAYPVYGWAACWVQIAIDMDTYEVTVEKLVHAVDVGKAIHPVIVKGQIEGGTLQALGWALWEHVAYQGGRVLNRRMTDCIIPTSIEAPEMETLIVEEPYPHGPHGAKGVGEIPMDGPGAAVANAVADALQGLTHASPDTLPLLPEAILQLSCGQAVEAWL